MDSPLTPARVGQPAIARATEEIWSEPDGLFGWVSYHRERAHVVAVAIIVVGAMLVLVLAGLWTSTASKEVWLKPAAEHTDAAARPAPGQLPAADQAPASQQTN